MVKTILYFHGFASSSDSEKADILKNYISSFAKKTISNSKRDRRNFDNN